MDKDGRINSMQKGDASIFKRALILEKLIYNILYF